jgi:hypothetical protein
MSKHVMAVASYYKLGKDGSVHSLEYKTLIEERVLVPRKHIDKINDQYKQCGKYYVIDEDATDKAFAEGEKKSQAIREAQANADELGKVMADTLKAVKKPKKAKPIVEPVETVVDVEVGDELEEAKHLYEELHGEKPHHMIGLKKLNKLNNEKLS